MLELPGLLNTGDVRTDLDTIRRYLAKLVPQLEMELMNAQQDRYAEAKNALTQGIGLVNENSTAGALVTHELRRDNPHGVTAAQLGLTLDRLLKVQLIPGGLVARIGEKRGIQINVQDVSVTINIWTQHGGVAYADTDLGAWAVKIPVLYYTGISVNGNATMDVWAGPLELSGPEQIGHIRIYHECNISTGEDESNSGTISETRIVRLNIIGMGVFGYDQG